MPATMRAAVLSAPGDGLVIEEIPTPRPGPGEVLIRVDACGVCHTDLHVIRGDVAFPTPAVLGHEVAGTVVAAGSRGHAVGTPVVTTFIMPCASCRFCAAGRDDLCETFFAMNRLNGTLYDGTSRLRRPDGGTLAMYSMAGLAEYAVVPETAVFPRPAGLDPGAAAILGCAFFTAYGAVRHGAGLVAGETVAVVGAGGVGSSILQVAAAFGASQVIAVDLQDDKLALATVCGATDTVNAGEGDAAEAVRELSGGGVDAAFEAIGLPSTWVQATEMVRDGGRVVAVGIGARGAAAPVEITRIVRRSISVVGSYGARGRTDMPAVVRLAELGRIRPADVVTQEFPLADADAAYSALDRGEIRGRAVLLP
ncbi:MAG TPA: zinc-binding dehydrogenase [Gaiellaceae bacterium]|nr:zinc-binding dehydrogenase [Gaiellaceae bacterium]